eukprot:458045_1
MTCETHFAPHMAFFSLYIIIETAQIILCSVALYQTMKLHKKKHFPILLLISQLIFYISALVFALARIYDTIFFCWIMDYQPLSFATLGATYSIHWFALLFILYSRLQLVFDETEYKLKKCTVYIIWFLFTFIIVVSAALNVMMAMGQPVTLLIGLMLVIVLTTAQILSFTFVSKLQTLRQKTKELNRKTDLKLFETVRKYAVLSVISVMFSTFYAFVMIIAALIGIWTYWVSEILALVLVLDVFVDSLCMALSINLNEKYYKKLCFINMLNYYWCHNGETHEVHIIASQTRQTLTDVVEDVTNTAAYTNDNVDLKSAVFTTELTDIKHVPITPRPKMRSITDMVIDIDDNVHDSGLDIDSTHEDIIQSPKQTPMTPTWHAYAQSKSSSPRQIVESGKSI